MDIVQKPRYKKGITICLLLICLFTLVFSQAAFAAPSSASISLTVDQTFIKPSSSSPADTFTYELTPQTAGSPMPAGSVGGRYTLSISGNGSVAIGPIPYTATGLYIYELKGTSSMGSGYTCDSEVYRVEVYVTGSTQADVVVYRSDGSKSSDILFQNKYKPLASDRSLMVDPPVKKTVSGTPAKDGTFVFKLEAGDKSNPMPLGSNNGVMTMTIVGSGEKDFGTWSYTEPGVYYYSISEVNVGEGGYTYDTGVYTITDDVKDVSGQLVLTRTVTNGAGKPVSSCGFINKYASPVVGGTTSGGAGPKTGDDSMSGLYWMLFVIGGMICIISAAYLLLWKRRKKQSDAKA